jgi:peptide chain release factor subunit 3
LLKWYDGLCLIDVLDAVKIPQRDPDGPLRIPVVDKFRDSGQFYLYGKI